MRDLILYIRVRGLLVRWWCVCMILTGVSQQADEASHRGVNHTLGNLDQVADPNPFLETEGGMAQPVNTKQVAVIRPGGLEQEELFKSRA